MRQSLLTLLALTLVLFACGGQKPAVAAKADTTAACCDSAALANCCPDSTSADCGGCVAPAVPTDTAAGKTAPAQCTS
jgi:hypothetical protein